MVPKMMTMVVMRILTTIVTTTARKMRRIKTQASRDMSRCQ